MNKNKKKLEEFIAYCVAHPEQRFWQALRNWNQLTDPDANYILTAEIDWDKESQSYKNFKDTFYR